MKPKQITRGPKERNFKEIKEKGMVLRTKKRIKALEG
jgi:hypothetical protein